MELAGLPESVSAYGWIPFAVVLLVAFLFSFAYIWHFKNRRESDVSTTFVTVCALCVGLLTSFLLPVDVFLVSFMKDSDGDYKIWAVNSTARETIENTVSAAYYALYGTLLIFNFIVLPMIYFFYEEKDDEIHTPILNRICTSLKYTTVFLLLAVALFLVGAYIPLKGAPETNTTDWERIEFLIDGLSQNRGEDALSFVLNILTVIGMFTMVIYTGTGLSIWPIEMLRGKRKASSEHQDIVEQRSSLQAKINTIREKYRNSNKPIPRREALRISALEEEDRLIERQENHLNEAKKSILQKCRPLIRPFQISLGAVGGVLAVIIWLSLLLCNIDKAIHSLGYKVGYALINGTLPNPLDLLLVKAQTVFPIDYILFTTIVCFLVVCTISGIQQMGIWFFFLRMYKIRSHKTRPQGLILLCASLIYTVLALNVLIYSTSPQYTTYGSQMFHDYNSTAIIPCKTSASTDDCMMTRISTLLLRFFYKAWIFGAFYYWASWIFLGVAVIAFVVAIFRKQRSAIAGHIEEDDLDDSDDEDLIRA